MAQLAYRSPIVEEAPLHGDCGAHFVDTVPNGSVVSLEISKSYRGSTASVHRCGSCGHTYFWPMPAYDDLEHFYNHEYGRHDIAAEYSERHQPALVQLNEDFKRLLKLERVRFHDEGCGYGHAVWHLNAAGANATGTDLSERSISMGRARGNTAISAETASQFLSRRNERVNALLMIHCLEHTYYPMDTMRGIRALLADRGAALIFVPNVEYLPILKQGMTADPHFLFPAHLHYFSVESLRRLFHASGFKVLELGTTANFDFAPNMADEMLRCAVGRCAAELRDPEALVRSLVANDLSYEIKALVARDDSEFFADWPRV